MSRVILHCDMNNFYASVECLLRPELRDKCIAVCGSVEDRHGIVLAKNERAKRYGVKTADTVHEAKRKCPGLVIVPPHFERYSYFSKKAFEIYCRYTDLIEPFGMDECWLDVTGSTLLFGSGRHIADEIRETVKSELGLTISVGVSFNKVFAKLGSDLKKPDATTVIDEQNYKKLIYGLPVDSLIGVGKSAMENIHRIGVDTIGELAAIPIETMQSRLGKQGTAIWHYANGLDNSPVMPANYHAPVKSISRGTTTVRDLENIAEVNRVLLMLSRQVASRLRKSGLVASGVQIAVRDNTLKTHDFQCKLPTETNSGQLIYERAAELFRTRYNWSKNIRSLTVRAFNLSSNDCARQIDMTYDRSILEKKERIDKAEDKIIQKFGKGTVKPLSLLENINVPKSRKDEI